MLVGALTVSAINGSPYENLKNAAINALFYDNFSFEGAFMLHVDGQVHTESRFRGYFGNESNLTISSLESESFPTGLENVFYTNPQFRVQTLNLSDFDIEWYMASRQSNAFTFQQSIGHEIFGVAGRDSNHLRLAELAIDFLAGDLKNNLAMGSYDGNRRISGAITESQLPELVRVLIDIAIEEQLRAGRWGANDNLQRSDFEDVLSTPIRSFALDRIQMHADIDDYGNLLYFNMLGIATIENIFGDTHVVEASSSMRFFDIGTTVPESPIYGITETLEGLFAHFDGIPELNMTRNRSLFFALDDEGNIIPESVSMDFPRLSEQSDMLEMLDMLDMMDLAAILPHLGVR